MSGFKRFMAPLLIVVLALGACGGDDSGSNEDADDSSAAGTEEYCANVLAIETAPEPEIDFEALTPEQQTEESKKYAVNTIRPLAEKIFATAPDELKADYETADKALDELEQTGDFETAFGNPDIVQAFNRVHAYDLDNCGWEQVDVVASNYKFDGVPATVPAGITSFEFDNTGTEQHEMVIFRKNDGETMSFDDILKIEDEAEAEKHMEFIAATGGDPNDEENLYSVADVKAGEYAIVCFVPVGSTPEAVKAAEDAEKEIEGAPHFTQGMKVEFKVT